MKQDVARDTLLLFSGLSSAVAGLTSFSWPQDLLASVNPLIGSTGPEPNLSGGMIPSVAPPFGSTRWVAQNQNNYVSSTPFNYTRSYEENGTVHGFMGTRQPAIWMGESAWVNLVPGISVDRRVKTEFSERGMAKVKGSEKFGVGLYSVELEVPETEGALVKVEMTATSRVGHLRFTFKPGSRSTSDYSPYIFLPTTRVTTIFHTPDIFDIAFPNGTVQVTPDTAEICGSNTEMQDWILAPNSIKDAASHFTGWYCARFDQSFGDIGYGVTQKDSQSEWTQEGSGEVLGAYARFSFGNDSSSEKELVVNVRVATSLISADQARHNLQLEIGDGEGASVESTSATTESAWAEKIGRFEITTDGSPEAEDKKAVFSTGVFHAMQYPYEVHEAIPNDDNDERAYHYYSAYDNQVHEGESYSGYSIWDTYRAEWAMLILLAPERIPGMIRSMLHDFEEGGWLPMWKNIIETNIMVGTHADSLLAEAVLKGFGGSSSNGLTTTFSDDELATIWAAAWKDASVPPVDDDSVMFSDREEGVDYEVRAGLSSFYEQQIDGRGWVANDIHSESVSRTLDYAYDDHAVAVLSELLPPEIIAKHTANVTAISQFWNESGPFNVTEFLHTRSLTAPWTVWNPAASAPALATGGESIMGFVEARQQNGSWAGPLDGFTEGDRWVYSFAVVHDVAQLIEHRGGNESFVKSLNEFFDGGWVDFTNEPAHHTPYLYALAGAASYTQERVREIAQKNYNNTPNGLSGNEDCGQMSAWYVFSAMGFYPVNPVSGVYVIGSPFFSSLTLHIPVPPFIPASHYSLTTDPNSPNYNPYYNITTSSYVLRVLAPGAESKPYVKSLRINGRVVQDWEEPLLTHDDIRFGGLLEFEMSENVESWGGGRGAWTLSSSSDNGKMDQGGFTEYSGSAKAFVDMDGEPQSASLDKQVHIARDEHVEL